jgi:hypothetical protein
MPTDGKENTCGVAKGYHAGPPGATVMGAGCFPRSDITPNLAPLISALYREASFRFDKQGDPVVPLLMLIFVPVAFVTMVSAWQLWRAAMAPLDGG